ncbi:FAD dependent oxidoreductase [Gymnopilus junonius]|uniref:FAD dependent oxidoreductase n=1 Tax=Gymnopilus junonius TaxID=109634 RepID=A0A9P5NN88_GYMJU|nr:FAD dependent oxidoreductase [Gymnopilus junonius]
MGSILSTALLALQAFKGIANNYDTLLARISDSPGLPVANSSLPFWTIPQSPIAQHGKDAPLPQYADVVIIGSGITGTSIAKAILELSEANQQKNTEPLQMVMLEARDACSGATGRNGGHASPIIYNEYEDLKKDYGVTVAQQILRFRIAHINGLIEVARQENLLSESQARLVEDYDAFLHPELFEKAKSQLDGYLKEVPDDMKEYFSVIQERSDIDKLQLSSSTVGLIVKPGNAIHAYRFVTGILSRLLTRFSNFQLYTSAPVTAVASNKDFYVVTTSRGNIRTRHVIHATNAWSSHLLPGLRKKIIPIRGHMTAQRPGKGLSPENDPNVQPWAGTRAFVFYPSILDSAYEYLTQLLPSPAANHPPSFMVESPGHDQYIPLPSSTSLPTAGEFMFGGGGLLGGNSQATLMNVFGVADDSETDFAIEAYLGGALERYFAGHWGEEGNQPDTDASNPPNGEWYKGRVKAFWTGIIGLSSDLQPWVGRVPRLVSGRKEPKSSRAQAPTPRSSSELKDKLTSVHSETNLGATRTAVAPGEWVCAGYTGEGMVHAWLSGQALARMVLGITEKDEKVPELPKPFLITEKRVKAANVERLMERIHR